MEKLIEELNKQTNNEYKFALKSATLTKAADFCMFEIFYKDGVMLSPEKKEEIKKIILSIAPKEFKYDVNFIKNFISEERIEDDFKYFGNMKQDPIETPEVDDYVTIWKD
jgi:hypothetical protein